MKSLACAALMVSFVHSGLAPTATAGGLDLSLVCEWTRSKLMVFKPVEQITKNDAGYEEEQPLSLVTILEFSASEPRMIESRWLGAVVEYLVDSDEIEISAFLLPTKGGPKYRVRGKSGVVLQAEGVLLTINRATGVAKKNISFPLEPEPGVGMVTIEHYGVCDRKKTNKF